MSQPMITPTREFLNEQIALMQMSGKIVTALTPLEIGYWLRRYQVKFNGPASKEMIEGWNRADQELGRTADLLEKRGQRVAARGVTA